MTTTCGIYKLTSKSGGTYIGSSCRTERRFKDHRRELLAGNHKNNILQKAFNKYGPLTEEVILICKREDLLMYEQIFLDELRPRYNLPGIAGHIEMTPAVRAKISASGMGRQVSKRSRLMSGLAQKGKTISLERREHLRQVNLGKRHTPETLAKMSKASTGRKPSLEGIEKRRKARTGVPLTESHRASLKAAWVTRKTKNYGYTKSSEAMKRAQAALVGVPLSSEHRAKLKAAWVRRRARGQAET